MEMEFSLVICPATITTCTRIYTFTATRNKSVKNKAKTNWYFQLHLSIGPTNSPFP